MKEHENNDFLDMIKKTAEFDRKESTTENPENDLTFRRDEDGVLRSYDAKTGEQVGRIYEHGDD